MVHRLSLSQSFFVALALTFLSTACLGWIYVFSYAIVLREAPPPWAGPAAEVSSAASLAFFGTMLGLKELGYLRTHAQIDIGIVPISGGVEPSGKNGSWRVDATVSLHPGQRPIRVRTFKGVIEPLYEGARFTRSPILLKPDPAAIDVSVESFSYLVEHSPLPPEGKHLRLTFWLVTDEGATTRVVKVNHDAGWYAPRAVEQWRDARWMRRRERKARRAARRFGRS